MRRCLVRDALSVSPEAVGMDLVRNLGSTWHPQWCVSVGDLATSMDLFAVLETQAASLDFWRCDPAFFTKYPEYAHCRMGQTEKGAAGGTAVVSRAARGGEDCGQRRNEALSG